MYFNRLFVLGLTILLGLNSFANTVGSVFLRDSILPMALKIGILKKLNTDCATGIMEYGLTEEESLNVSQSAESSNLKKFRTLFRSRTLSDGMHPKTANIVVDSSIVESLKSEDEVLDVLIIDGECKAEL